MQIISPLVMCTTYFPSFAKLLNMALFNFTIKILPASSPALTNRGSLGLGTWYSILFVHTWMSVTTKSFRSIQVASTILVT